MGPGLVSLLLAIAALLGTIAGVLLTPFPSVAAALSFAAPLLAVASVVAGAVAISRARRMGDRSTLGLVGLVSGVLVFCPSTFVAMTCGMCNAMVGTHGGWQRTDGGMHFRFQQPPPGWHWPDGGMRGAPAPPPGMPPAPPPPPGAWAVSKDGGTSTQPAPSAGGGVPAKARDGGTTSGSQPPASAP